MKLITLTIIFALLRYYHQIDWDWIYVVSPILVSSAFLLLRILLFLAEGTLVIVFGSKATAIAFVARLEKKVAKKHAKDIAVVKGIRDLLVR